MSARRRTKEKRGGEIKGTNQFAASAIDSNDALTTIAETLVSAGCSIADNILNSSGTRPTGSPTQLTKLRANYSFSHEALKGVSRGAPAWPANNRLHQFEPGDPAVDLRQGEHRLGRLCWLSEKAAHALVHVVERRMRYRLPRSSHDLERTFGLSVSNVFDKFNVKTRKGLGDSRSILFSYSISHLGSR